MTVVVVMGVSGAGKSTVGAALAARLGVPFADGDGLHPAANVAKMREGVPLDDADRAPWLDAVAGWLAAHRAGGGVMSCSALRVRYRDRLRRAVPEAFFLHLDAVPEVLAARLAARPGHFMPVSLLASQLATLERLAPAERGAVVDAGGAADSVLARALAALEG